MLNMNLLSFVTKLYNNCSFILFHFFFNLKTQLRVFLTNLLGQLRYRLKTKDEIC